MICQWTNSHKITLKFVKTVLLHIYELVLYEQFAQKAGVFVGVIVILTTGKYKSII